MITTDADTCRNATEKYGRIKTFSCFQNGSLDLIIDLIDHRDARECVVHYCLDTKCYCRSVANTITPIVSAVHMVPCYKRFTLFISKAKNEDSLQAKVEEKNQVESEINVPI